MTINRLTITRQGRHLTHPKFYTKDGWLTPYGLACGYQETAGHRNVIMKLWHDGGTVYHVRAHDHDGRGRLFWEIFETLTEARRFFRAMCKEYGLTRH